MKNGIFTIMKKELARFFGDKRMAFTTILLPGLLIYVLYSFMGSAIGNMYSMDDDYVPSIMAVNLPESIKTAAESGDIPIEQVSVERADEIKGKISDKQIDLYMVFPQDFDSAIASYDTASGTAAPNIEIYYNTTSANSQGAYMMMTSLLDGYESQLANKFDVNAGGEGFDLATKEDTTGSIFASMLPMLLMIFMFSGCMAVAPESIAGEKERGTIATMLITPVKRSHIAIGKITALAIIALLSGISSATGTILSLPKLMGTASDEIAGNIYSISDYLMLGIVVLSTVLLIITLISIISAFAKTIKEAQTYIMPMMIVVMLIGVTAMFGSGAKEEIYYYLIPLYNSVQCMVGIFSFDIVPVNVAASILSNLVYTGAGVFVLAKMFNSEKIVFSK